MHADCLTGQSAVQRQIGRYGRPRPTDRFGAPVACAGFHRLARCAGLHRRLGLAAGALSFGDTMGWNRSGLSCACIDVSEISAPDIAAGTALSFEAFYAQRWLPMVRLATLTTGSTPMAEEIVQDAFVQLHRNWLHVQNPSAWLRTAVVNQGRSWVRRQVLERRHQPRRADAAMPDEGVVVRAALDKLSSRQRAAVVLRFYEDLPEAEIAQILGCRPGTVKSLLDRSKHALRKELQQ